MQAAQQHQRTCLRQNKPGEIRGGEREWWRKVVVVEGHEEKGGAGERGKEGKRNRRRGAGEREKERKTKSKAGERDRSHVRSARVLTQDTTAQTLWRKEEGSQLAVWVKMGAGSRDFQ